RAWSVPWLRPCVASRRRSAVARHSTLDIQPGKARRSNRENDGRSTGSGRHRQGAARRRCAGPAVPAGEDLQRLRRRGGRRHHPPALRAGEAGTDPSQLLPGALRVREDARGQGETGPDPRRRQPRQDHGRPVHRDRGLRHGLLREAAGAVPAHRRAFVVRRQPGAGAVPRRLAQQQPAGRLPDARGARAGAGLRPDVGLRPRQAGRRVLRRHLHPFQLPGQPRPGRSGEHLPAFAAAAVRRSLPDRVTTDRTTLFPRSDTTMFKKLVLAAALAGIAFGASADPVEYTIVPTHTMVLASWNHFGYSNPTANFGEAKGTITYDADAPENSKVEVMLPL